MAAGGGTLTPLSVAGVALLLVVALAVVLNGAGGDEPSAGPTTTPSHTPLPLEPDAPGPPTVTATRSSDRVTFTWKPAEQPQDGDSYEWKRDDTGEGSRTTDRRLTVRGNDKVCLQVRQIRDSLTSGWTQECA